MRIRSTVLLSMVVVAVFTATLAIGRVGQAATINWKGHTWNVTAGGMAGVCQASAANLAIDTDGYLHMKLTNNGGTWSGAEIFTTDKIGFGTYQWQIDGPVDKLDRNVVVGLYPYGPEAGIGNDGQNEIDIEYARWGDASYPNGNYTVYPPTGTGSTEITFDFTLTGTYTTSRFTWSSTKIDFASLSGFEPLGSTAGLIKAWTFSPATPTTKIPQQALPLGMNLWCFQAPPSNGQNVEIIVRDFTFVPLGGAIDAGVADGGAAGGAGGSGGAGGKGGAVGTDASVGTGGTAGVSGIGGSLGTGGISALGGRGGTGGAAGATGTGGLRGTGGAPGTGGAVGTGGLIATGGAVGTGGLIATGGSSGSAAPGTGGTSGTGGLAVTPSTQPVAKASGGCSCSTPAVRGAISGQTLIVLAGVILVVRRRGKRPRSGRE